jgi:acetyl esterase/lipase
MRANARTHHVNPAAIGAIGGSAGAHLVAMLATSDGTIALEGSGGHAAASSQVQSVVAMGGAFNLQPRYAMGTEFVPAVAQFVGEPLETHVEALTAASPITYVSSRSAPLLLMHSRTDPLVSFEQSAEMERQYRRAGAPVTLVAIDAPDVHGFWGDPRFFPEAIERAVDFFRKTLNIDKPQ